jgi:hypothetical protein
MPYIESKERRKELDQIVDYLANHQKTYGYRILGATLEDYFFEKFMSLEGTTSVTAYPLLELFHKLKVEITGEVNYILFKFCKYHINPSYNNYKKYISMLLETARIIETTDKSTWFFETKMEMENFVGEIRMSCLEIYRKILGPYEDKKIEENGDI